jgi:hypothetical protein
VTNALKHVGWKYSAKFDLQTFFDNVTDEMVDDVPSYCFIKGRTRQGLPTSPVVASLAFVPTAYGIRDEIERTGIEFSMTVYADDITVSFNNVEDFQKIREIVYKRVKSAGLKVNYRKTKLKYGHKKGMRRIICGVGVDETGIHPTRESKRKQSTAFHNGNVPRAVGLMEWNSLKLPNAVQNAYRKEKNDKFSYSKNGRRREKKWV